MPVGNLKVVDLEEKLHADSDGSLRNELATHLSAVRGEVKRAIDAGLAPDEFERAQQIHTGLERAAAVVDDVWNNLHA
ncbi:MAG: EscE/YscE/SsaE family type III secretion system needle protein co-chaperone [Planctomycetota bacterium]